MIRALFGLMALQLAGETASTGLGLPVPGPVLGMAALLAILLARRGVPLAMEHTARGLLDNLGLLFVPAGVGVTLHLSEAAAEWPAILAAVIGGTLVAMIGTALAFGWLAKLSGSRE